MLLTAILLTIILGYYVTTWILEAFAIKHARRPRRFPGYLPIIGHAHLFYGNTIHLWNMLKALSDNSLANDGVCTINFGPWTINMLTDPEDCYYVGSSCLHKDGIYDMAKPWLGEGLVTGSAHIWKRHRKLVNPAFSQHVLDGYLTVFNAHSRKLIGSLEVEVGKEPFDHAPYLERTALEVICLTAMGIDNNDSVLNNTAYMDAVSKIFNMYVQRVQNMWLQNDLLYKLSTLRRKEDDLIKTLHNMSISIIQKRKSAFLGNKYSTNSENMPNRFKSFLDLLLESSFDGSLSDSEIREEVDTMISAGFDTSATLMTLALVLIGSFPKVQDKIYNELLQVFEGSNRDVEKQDLPKLVYLEAVIKECLRLYPVVPLVARYLDKNVELKNHTLAAGTTCFFLIYGIHRHSMWGSDVDVFRPERWLTPADLPKAPNAGFAGFSLGKRTCIGQKFALTSTKTTLSHILRHYRLFADHKKMTLKMDIMLKADSGHHIRIERRKT